jgi:hypothetical protein
MCTVLEVERFSGAGVEKQLLMPGSVEQYQRLGKAIELLTERSNGTRESNEPDGGWLGGFEDGSCLLRIAAVISSS